MAGAKAKAQTERDPIPEMFDSYAEAAEFWDNHSTADYKEFLEDVEVDFEGSQSVVLMPVPTSLYAKLRSAAKAQNLSAEELLHSLIAQKLEPVSAP